MKKHVVLLAALLGLAWGAFAQQKQETLFGTARIKGAFGGPIFEWGLNNDLQSASGGGGALVIGHAFVGAYGMGSTDFSYLLETGDLGKIDLGHGGLWLGVGIPSYKLLHFYGSTRIGWGAVNFDVDDPGLRYEDFDKVFVASPEVGVEMNITKWFRLAGSVGYRYVNGVSSIQPFNNDDLRGFTGGLTLRFGWFGNRNW